LILFGKFAFYRLAVDGGDAFRHYSTVSRPILVPKRMHDLDSTEQTLVEAQTEQPWTEAAYAVTAAAGTWRSAG
jgi:hypothetical protein